MTDNNERVPQTLAPNALILGELKPTVFVRWIILAMDFGPLDYKSYEWPELEKLLNLTRKPVGRLLNSLEAAGWLSQEKTRDGVRIYLLPTNEGAEEHLADIKQANEYASEVNQGRRYVVGRAKPQSYRNRYMARHGNFTMVPETILNDGRFSLNELATYVVIRCTTDDHSFWGTRALANAAGVSQPTLTKALKTLKESGYLVYDGVQRVSNRYGFNEKPEPVFSQMEPGFSQGEPVFSQTEPAFSPINTELNTEEINTELDTDPQGEAQGLGENRGRQSFSDLNRVPSQGRDGTEVFPGTELSHSVRRTLASLGTKEQSSTEVMTDLNRSNASYQVVTKEEEGEEEMRVQVPASDDVSYAGSRTRRVSGYPQKTYAEVREEFSALKRSNQQAKEAKREAARLERPVEPSTSLHLRERESDG
ncbi:hypothetical protein [Streptomyces hyaluromycini]|uniref:hypothetical protein n=1 Tax=Streptomyces hyaluromycini TaxID=1377993 RepID=UPI0011AE7E2E|nr:hypothetical protein [Streptomyces hyaluromycini]